MISMPAGLFRVTMISNQKPLITVPNERTLTVSFMMFLRIICIYLELLRAGRPSDIQEMSKCLRLALGSFVGVSYGWLISVPINCSVGTSADKKSIPSVDL